MGKKSWITKKSELRYVKHIELYTAWGQVLAYLKLLQLIFWWLCCQSDYIKY